MKQNKNKLNHMLKIIIVSLSIVPCRSNLLNSINVDPSWMKHLVIFLYLGNFELYLTYLLSNLFLLIWYVGKFFCSSTDNIRTNNWTDILTCLNFIPLYNYLALKIICWRRLYLMTEVQTRLLRSISTVMTQFKQFLPTLLFEG